MRMTTQQLLEHSVYFFAGSIRVIIGKHFAKFGKIFEDISGDPILKRKVEGATPLADRISQFFQIVFGE